MTTGRMRHAGRTTDWITASVFTLVVGSFGLFAQARVEANELVSLAETHSKTSSKAEEKACILCTQSLEVICAATTKESLIRAAGEILYN
ncbi:MAG: hypothetical protein ACJAVI_000933 [Candidatus Azotimanducaceae bacterium]|jgi:hypothetical protein